MKKIKVIVKTKPIKIGNNLRDLLLKSEFTLVNGNGTCWYFDEFYAYNPYTAKEIEGLFNKAKESFGILLKPRNNLFNWFIKKFKNI
jgi:hypothetical protein